jgi:hypothetical protein
VEKKQLSLPKDLSNSCAKEKYLQTTVMPLKKWWLD